jgi:nucleotide-binding universal stress UspA family protein
MFRTILVPLDGSAESSEALPVARTIAESAGGSIWLLQVAAEPGLSDDHTATHAAGQSVEAIARRLAGSRLDIHPVTREGDVAREILQLSNEIHADLIVMRTRGRVGLERAVFGSVAQEVLKSARIPIVLVHPGQRRIGHIEKLLVPVDGSRCDGVALQVATDIAGATHAAITILEVVAPVSPLAYANPLDVGGAAYYDPAWDYEVAAAAQRNVASVAARLGGLGVSVEGEVRTKDRVPETIVATAAQIEADLIVMSTHVLTGAARAILGSVADAVMRTAPCPVLLVRCV